MIAWFFNVPRRAWALICLACIGMLAFGLYLQHVVGLVPCPMCIVQRYALILVAVCAGLAALSGINGLQKSFGALGLVAAVGGAWTAARQSWLQWYPPEVVSCGRDLYGMIETFPLKRALPMIFRGSGDCSKVDWTLLGLSLANWSFIAFAVLAILAIVLLARGNRAAKAQQNMRARARA